MNNKPPICCGTQVNVQHDVKKNGETGEKGVGLWCGVCQSKSWGTDLSEAIAVYADKHKDKITPEAPKEKKKPMQNNQPPTVANKPTNNLPTNPQDFALMVQSQESRLMEIMSPIVSGDQSAVKLLIRKNIRYVENAEQIQKAWTTPEGQASIVRALEDVFIMGACLGETGDLVPYGNIVEFIPSVEAYSFALTNGTNAPFDNIEIELIHENDTVQIARKDGDFKISLDMGIPRGEVVAVAVYGFRVKTGKVEGEVYDKDRLMKKAEEHSTSYQYYLQDVRQAEALRSEGKLQSENGREYFIKKIFKKGGGSWDKKVFIDEMTNPYAGADQPEMLRKTAGKSFMRKYNRVRNSEAAMEEVRTSEKMVDATLNMGDSVFDV